MYGKCVAWKFTNTNLVPRFKKCELVSFAGESEFWTCVLLVILLNTRSYISQIITCVLLLLCIHALGKKHAVAADLCEWLGENLTSLIDRSLLVFSEAFVWSLCFNIFSFCSLFQAGHTFKGFLYYLGASERRTPVLGLGMFDSILSIPFHTCQPLKGCGPGLMPQHWILGRGLEDTASSVSPVSQMYWRKKHIFCTLNFF